MNFSLFSNDDTFGQDSGVKRVVVLQGTTQLSSWVPTVAFNPQSDIVRWLQAEGFDVVGVRLEQAGWTGATMNLEIEVNAYTNYSAEQIRQKAIQVIESITRSFGTTIKVFWNTSLRITSDALWQQGGNNQQGNNNQLPSNPNYDSNYPTKVPPPDAGSDIWKKFFENAGLTAPVAIVGGALLLILMLRR